MSSRTRFVGEHEYYPTSVEVLAEELTRSFGSELLEADDLSTSFPGILTRKSSPVIVERADNESEALLQFQYSRFSPFYSNRLLDVWNKSAKPEARSVDDIYKFLADNNQTAEVALNPDILPHAALARAREVVYVAAFSLSGLTQEDVGKPEPFNIFEDGGHFWQREADLFIKYHRAEVFYIKGQREDMSGMRDVLSFTTPAMWRGHERGLSAASRFGVFHKEVGDDAQNHTQKRFRPWESRSFNTSVPEEQMMSTIQAYLRGRFTGTTLV